MTSEKPDNKQDEQSNAYKEPLDKIEISKSVAVAVVKSSHNQENNAVNSSTPVSQNRLKQLVLQQRSQLILVQLPIYEKIILFLLDYFEKNNTTIYEDQYRRQISFYDLKRWTTERAVEKVFNEGIYNHALDLENIEKYINEAKTDERNEINNRKISESLKQQIYDYLNELLL
jgi:hypothetical protein